MDPINELRSFLKTYEVPESVQKGIHDILVKHGLTTPTVETLLASISRLNPDDLKRLYDFLCPLVLKTCSAGSNECVDGAGCPALENVAPMQQTKDDKSEHQTETQTQEDKIEKECCKEEKKDDEKEQVENDSKAEEKCEQKQDDQCEDRPEMPCEVSTQVIQSPKRMLEDPDEEGHGKICKVADTE